MDICMVLDVPLGSSTRPSAHSCKMLSFCNFTLNGSQCWFLKNKLRIGCLFPCLTDKRRFDFLMSFYVHFLKVFITAIVCLAPIINCCNSRISGI